MNLKYDTFDMAIYMSTIYLVEKYYPSSCVVSIPIELTILDATHTKSSKLLSSAGATSSVVCTKSIKNKMWLTLSVQAREAHYFSFANSDFSVPREDPCEQEQPSSPQY